MYRTLKKIDQEDLAEEDLILEKGIRGILISLDGTFELLELGFLVPYDMHLRKEVYDLLSHPVDPVAFLEKEEGTDHETDKDGIAQDDHNPSA